MINLVESFSYDDLMLIPRYSDVISRSEINLSVQFTKDIVSTLPFISANMKTVTELAMAKIFWQNKAITLLHRFADFTDQIQWLEEIKKWENGTNYIGFSIGIKDSEYKKVDHLITNGVKIICIDVAHADCERCVAMTNYINNNYPHVFLIVGTVATGAGALRLWGAGADAVRCGIGCGSTCLTRIKTGVGIGSMSALNECYDAKVEVERQLKKQLFLIADGGMKAAGDVSKALVYADTAILGNMFAGSDETPSELIEFRKKKYKIYAGSSTYKSNYKEGVEGLVPYKGSAQSIINSICEGISSTLSYQGVRNLQDFRQVAKFIRVTGAGIVESNAHSLAVIKN